MYFNFNGTPGTGPNGNENFEATRTRVLFNLTGTAAQPVKDVTIRGLHLRDTQITYLDPHGMPSGGDWALDRCVQQVKTRVTFVGLRFCNRRQQAGDPAGLRVVNYVVC